MIYAVLYVVGVYRDGYIGICLQSFESQMRIFPRRFYFRFVRFIFDALSVTLCR